MNPIIKFHTHAIDARCVYIGFEQRFVIEGLNWVFHDGYPFFQKSYRLFGDVFFANEAKINFIKSGDDRTIIFHSVFIDEQV